MLRIKEQYNSTKQQKDQVVSHLKVIDFSYNWNIIVYKEALHVKKMQTITRQWVSKRQENFLANARKS